MYKNNSGKINKSTDDKRRQLEKVSCDELVIAYHDTPCGMFDLENCPFDCKNCDDCEELFHKGADKQ